MIGFLKIFKIKPGYKKSHGFNTQGITLLNGILMIGLCTPGSQNDLNLLVESAFYKAFKTVSLKKFFAVRNQIGPVLLGILN